MPPKSQQQQGGGGASKGGAGGGKKKGGAGGLPGDLAQAEEDPLHAVILADSYNSRFSP